MNPYLLERKASKESIEINVLLTNSALAGNMDSESWPSIFGELEAAESKLAAAIDQIEEAVKSGSAVKTGHKSDAWRTIHAQISKASKNVERVS